MVWSQTRDIVCLLRNKRQKVCNFGSRCSRYFQILLKFNIQWNFHVSNRKQTNYSKKVSNSFAFLYLSLNGRLLSFAHLFPFLQVCGVYSIYFGRNRATALLLFSFLTRVKFHETARKCSRVVVNFYARKTYISYALVSYWNYVKKLRWNRRWNHRTVYPAIHFRSVTVNRMNISTDTQEVL